MKRSNLILLTSAICSVMLIAAIPMLYHRELSKSHEHTPVSVYSRQTFPGSKVVKVINMKAVTTLSADSLAVEWKPDAAGNFTINQTGDTLIIEGDGEVFIHLANQPLVAVGSDVLVRGDLAMLDAPSLSFVLRNSRLYSLPISRETKVGQFLQDLSITDKGNSMIDLSGHFGISKLQLRNVERFSCTNDVGFLNSEFLFEEGRDVKTLTCLEGLNIYSH